MGEKYLFFACDREKFRLRRRRAGGRLRRQAVVWKAVIGTQEDATGTRARAMALASIYGQEAGALQEVARTTRWFGGQHILIEG
jgi:hypothetical protein